MNNLTIEKIDSEISIKLDGVKLKNIKEYEIKNSATGVTELTIKLDVK